MSEKKTQQEYEIDLLDLAKGHVVTYRGHCALTAVVCLKAWPLAIPSC